MDRACADQLIEEGFLKCGAGVPARDFSAWCSAVPSLQGGWPAFLERAGEHGLAAVIYQAALDAGAEIPADLRAAFDRQLAFERLAHAGAMAAMMETLALMRGRGIECLILKGPPLGRRVYGDASLRPSSDLDLLIAEKDLGAAVAALEGAGFRAESGAAADYNRAHLHHITLERAGSPPVELHFKAFTGFGVAIPSEPLLARARPEPSPLGPDLLTLDPLDELVFLIAHAAGHMCARLGWIYEIKLLIEKNTALDWGALAERARELKVFQTVAFTLRQFELMSVARVSRPDESGEGSESSALESRPTRAPLEENSATFSPAAAHSVPFSKVHSLRFALARAALRRGEKSFRRFERPTLARIFFQAALCDQAADSARFLAHHLGRIARRRAHRWFPRMAPASWAG